jgi:hypothetical protein
MHRLTQRSCLVDAGSDVSLPMSPERAWGAFPIGAAIWLAACTSGPPRGHSDGSAQLAADACPAVTCSVTPAYAGDAAEVAADLAAPPGSGSDLPEASTGADVAAPPPDGDGNDVRSERAADGPDSGCPGLFCEDFEAGALDPAKWTVTSGVNHVDDATPPPVVESTLAAHGRFAAHFHGKGNVSNDDAFIVTRHLPPDLLVHHFGRLYFYVSTKPTSGHTMWVLGGSAGMSASPKLRDFEVATINGGWQLGFDQLGMSPSGEEVFYPGGAVPVAKWTCLEWELDDAPDTDTIWIDGKELGTLDDRHIDYPPGHVPGTPMFDGKSAGLVGGFSTYSFGFYDWHPNVDFDLYFDDIVLDAKRVGCL